MPLNILVVGAGVCGPTFAALLQRANPAHNITVIERAPALRAQGLQLDFKAQGTPIMRKMGLLEEMRRFRVLENGHELVGAKGERLAAYGIKKDDGTEEGKLGLTNEIEIMRGDMVRVLYEHGLKEREALQAKGVKEGSLKYEFGTAIKGLSQDGHGVDVTFEDGKEQRFDLVVGADGQNSRTRRQAFGDDVSSESFKELGTQVAYFNIPRGGSDNSLAKIFFAPRGRAVMLRNGDRPETQIYLFSNDNQDKIKASYSKTPAEQKTVWAETFKDAGWEMDRFLKGMHASKDFYTHHLAQIKLPALYKSRVVLIGDAGYCPSVMTGKGTTASFIGAYMLAGELARHPADVDAALKAYDEVMKEPVGLSQQLSTSGVAALPSSPLAVWAIRNGIWAVSKLRLDKLAMKLMPEKKAPTGLEAWVLPEYPELKLADGKE